MRELLPAEFYKLYKSLGFRVCLIVFFVQDIIYLISVVVVGDNNGIELTGDFQFQYLLGSFSGSSVSGMLFGFIEGHSRAHIMFAKIIVYIVAIWILSLEDILVYTVGGCICGGFGKAFTMDVAGYMLRSVACEGFVLTMLYMTCVFLAFALTSKAASVSVNLLLFFLVDLGVQIMPVLFQSDVLEKILGYMPFSSVREMSQVDIDWSHAGISLAVAAAYGTVMIVATWLTFRKRDLR